MRVGSTAKNLLTRSGHDEGTSMAIQTSLLRRQTIAEPGTACTETYLVARQLKSEAETARHAGHRRTWVVDEGADD